MRLPITFALTLSGTAAGMLWAQSVPTSPSPGSPASARAPSATSQPARAKNPSEKFRQMLAMSEAEREKALVGEPAQLRAILKEYDALSPAERESRLRMAELRYYLLQLMGTPPAGRAALLARVPAEDRNLVNERLAKWDKLAPDLQKEVLENAWMITAVMRYGPGTPTQAGTAADSIPNERRKQIEDSTQAFQQLSAEKRSRMVQNFGQVLGMDDKEKTRVLSQVPASERQRMEKTLQEFEKVAPSERPEVIKSLKEFANMTPFQQSQFFANAEKWSHLSESEKAIFRKLIVEMPPLPPGAELPPLPLDTGPAMPLKGEIVHGR